MEGKEIKLGKEYRLKGIMDIASEVEGMSIFKFREIKAALRTIELLANTKVLTEMNNAIKNIKKGNYLTEEEFLNKTK